MHFSCNLFIIYRLFPTISLVFNYVRIFFIFSRTHLTLRLALVKQQMNCLKDSLSTMTSYRELFTSSLRLDQHNHKLQSQRGGLRKILSLFFYNWWNYFSECYRYQQIILKCFKRNRKKFKGMFQNSERIGCTQRECEQFQFRNNSLNSNLVEWLKWNLIMDLDLN